jgi:hypothetical protein
MPHAVSTFFEWNSNVFFGVVDTIEKAKINPGGVL